MKLLFCCRAPVVTKELGTPKGLLELSEYLRPLGWQCDVIGGEQIMAAGGENFNEALRRYLQSHAADYDVVEYDHKHLPYPRSDFPATTLLVARSFLLTQHLTKFPIPVPKNWKTRLKYRVKAASRRAKEQQSLHNSNITVREADLINVNNTDAKDELVERGIAPDKIVVFGRAIGRERRVRFDAISSEPPAVPIIAFVGSYDYRKGADDFPILMRSILARVPQARFKLLGTKGLLTDAAQVRAFFSPEINARTEVVPRFNADDLPELLSDCSVGVFPSYREGFGFGVLEMLAASLPVVAYNAPGPPMMLPASYLVPVGDVQAMSARVVELLSSPEELRAARIWAKQRSQDFTWPDIAQRTSDAYQQHWRALNAK